MSDASVTDAATLPPADPDTSSERDATASTPDALAPAVAAAAESMRFTDFPVADTIKRALAEMGYVAATEVQARVVAPAIAGRDLLVQSKTGSGKTSAFGVPLVHRLVPGTAKPKRPHALILLPTRELAHQVAEELTRLTRHHGTRVQAIYGGVTIARQSAALLRGMDVVVGTPGRLLDHIRRQNLELSAVQTVVLDEADEMLSMGFWDDVTELIRLTPKDRQTLLFSATLPYEVAKSAAHLMRDVVRLDLSGDDLTVSGIDNCILHVNSGLPKPRQLLYVLEGEQPRNAIIFCNTRNETEMLAKYLTQSGLMAEPLSGNFKQKERERTMARIKNGELRFMVATDIAARGIDINDLTHVFNYSLPEFCEVYLHRVGRTGRAGKVGRAVSLVDGKGLGTLTVLEREFGISFTELTMPPEQQVVLARSKRIMKELRERAQVAELGQHLAVAQNIVLAPEAAQLVAFLLKSYFASQAKLGRDAAEAEADRLDAEADAEHDAPAGGRVHGTGAAAKAGHVPRGRPLGEGDERRRRGGRSSARDDGARTASAQARDLAADSPPTPAPRAMADARSTSRPPGAEGTRERGQQGGRGRPSFEVIDADEMLRLPRRPASGPRPPARPSAGGAPEVRAVPPRRPSLGVSAPSAPAPAVPREPPAPPELEEPLEPGMCRLRVNIGFDDGFKGRGAVAKKVCALAGLNEGIVTEVASRRDHAVLKAKLEVVEMVRERVDGARLGKKVLSLTVLV